MLCVQTPRPWGATREGCGHLSGGLLLCLLFRQLILLSTERVFQLYLELEVNQRERIEWRMEERLARSSSIYSRVVDLIKERLHTVAWETSPHSSMFPESMYQWISRPIRSYLHLFVKSNSILLQYAILAILIINHKGLACEMDQRRLSSQIGLLAPLLYPFSDEIFSSSKYPPYSSIASVYIKKSPGIRAYLLWSQGR